MKKLFSCLCFFHYYFEVMAPTQTLWVNKEGEMFIADSEVLADLWDSGVDVRPTGAWKVFAPQKVGE